MKWIQNVKSTDLSLINIVTGKNLLRADPTLSLVLFSQSSYVYPYFLLLIAELEVNDLSPNQIWKAWFKSVLFVILILNDKKLSLYGHHILIFHYK